MHQTTASLDSLSEMSKLKWIREGFNKFVNSDGQWLLSFYKIVTQLLSYSLSFVFLGLAERSSASQKLQNRSALYLHGALAEVDGVVSVLWRPTV